MDQKRPSTSRRTPVRPRPPPDKEHTFRPQINQYARSGVQYTSPYSQRPGSSHLDIRTRMRANPMSDKENTSTRPYKTDDEIHRQPPREPLPNQQEIDEIMKANATRIEEIIEEERARQQKEQIEIRFQHEEEISRLRQDFKQREQSLISQHQVLDKKLRADDDEYEEYIAVKEKELVRKESEIQKMHLQLIRTQKELKILKTPTESRRQNRVKIPPTINFDSSLNYSDFSAVRPGHGHVRKSSSFGEITSDFSNLNFDTSIPFLNDTEDSDVQSRAWGIDSKRSSRPGTRENHRNFSKLNSRPMTKEKAQRLRAEMMQSKTWEADSQQSSRPGTREKRLIFNKTNSRPMTKELIKRGKRIRQHSTASRDVQTSFQRPGTKIVDNIDKYISIQNWNETLESPKVDTCTMGTSTVPLTYEFAVQADIDEKQKLSMHTVTQFNEPPPKAPTYANGGCQTDSPGPIEFDSLQSANSPRQEADKTLLNKAPIKGDRNQTRQSSLYSRSETLKSEDAYLHNFYSRSDTKKSDEMRRSSYGRSNTQKSDAVMLGSVSSKNSDTHHLGGLPQFSKHASENSKSSSGVANTVKASSSTDKAAPGSIQSINSRELDISEPTKTYYDQMHQENYSVEPQSHQAPNLIYEDPANFSYTSNRQYREEEKEDPISSMLAKFAKSNGQQNTQGNEQVSMDNIHPQGYRKEQFSPIKEEMAEASLNEEDDTDVFEASIRIQNGQIKPSASGTSPKDQMLQDLYADYKSRRKALKRLNESHFATKLRVTFLHEFNPEKIDNLDPAIKPVSVSDTFLLTRGSDLDGEWLEGVNENSQDIEEIQLFPTCYVYPETDQGEAYMAVDEFNPSMLETNEIHGVRFLKFKYSEIIVVTKYDFQEGWSEGYLINRSKKRKGKFPTAYVRKLLFANI